MRFAVFPSQDAFLVWHARHCTEHRIPHPNRNFKSGALALNKQWTVAWADPYRIDGQLVVVFDPTDPDLAGLPLVELNLDEEVGPVPTVERDPFPYRRPVPSDWEGVPVPRQQ